MIDVTSENLIRIADVPRHLPPRPDGRRTHISTVYRWITRGVGRRHTVLESVTLGGTTYTSQQALHRFADRLTGQRSQPPTPPRRTTRSRQAQARRAAAEVTSELGLDQATWNSKQPITPAASTSDAGNASTLTKDDGIPVSDRSTKHQETHVND